MLKKSLNLKNKNNNKIFKPHQEIFKAAKLKIKFKKKKM